MLLLVDQFEEIFRFRKEDPTFEADAFVSLLLESAAQREEPIYVVITMRSDYIGDCAVFTGLPEALNRSQYLTPRLTREQMRAAIEGPARVFDGDVEPALVNMLLNEAGRDPDDLPVLQHLLMRMWTYQRKLEGPCAPGTLAEARPAGQASKLAGRVLTLADYKAVGEFELALSDHANEAYEKGLDKAQLGERGRHIAEIMFRSLCVGGVGKRDSRRPTTVSELTTLSKAKIPDVTDEEVMAVADVFRKPQYGFLTPAYPERLKPDTFLDITHESLIRHWDLLKEWVQKEAESVDTYRSLEHDAQAWEKSRAGLRRSPDLDVAVEWRDREKPIKEWAARYGGDLELALQFLEASVTLREAEKRGFDAELVQRLQSLGYEIDEQISQSDFGILYRARHLADDRPVALKTLAASRRVADRDSLVREAEVTGQLGHEGIVSVLEVHTEASPPFFIMEWVDGQPINQALKGADWYAKASVLEAVCDSIEYAHRRGVVHGDLKPSNILIPLDRRPKVLDFGLSRLLHNEADSSRGSSMGAVGTALYMAPEQVRGENPGPGTDVYALGTILYELLTGEPPFAADNLHDVRTAQLHQAPDLPMLRNEEVPEQLQRICLKALEKKDADRYGSVQEMRDDLKRYRHGKPVSVRPSYYNNLIESPAKDHVEQIEEWYKKFLITESEYVRLRRAYETMTRSGLKAVSESRLVHRSVLTLYLGTWLFLAGAAMWLILYYLHREDIYLGLVKYSLFRVVLGVLPALITNWLWLFFTKKGSYRFAFAAMILGLISLPFAVGVAVYEVAQIFGGFKWLHAWMALGDGEQHLFPKVPIPEMALALLVALAWDTYVAIKSRTLTSTTVAGIHFVLLYLAVLDVWGLPYLFDFDKGLGYGGLWMLLAAGILGLAGTIVGKRPEQTGQSKPLFAIAIVVAILASQGIALGGPNTWEWWGDYFGSALFEILLGMIYLGSSIYLRNRFRVEGATAYLVLARLAPVTFLTGIGIVDWGWYDKKMPQLLINNLTPWAPVLLVASVGVVFLAARLQSPFYSIVGLGSLAYAVGRIAYEIKGRGWQLPVIVMVAGFAVMAWLTWRDLRERVGQDIDDVAEELIIQSRKSTPTTESGPDLETVADK